MRDDLRGAFLAPNGNLFAATQPGGPMTRVTSDSVCDRLFEGISEGVRHGPDVGKSESSGTDRPSRLRPVHACCSRALHPRHDARADRRRRATVESTTTREAHGNGEESRRSRCRGDVGGRAGAANRPCRPLQASRLDRGRHTWQDGIEQVLCRERCATSRGHRPMSGGDGER